MASGPRASLLLGAAILASCLAVGLAANLLASTDWSRVADLAELRLLLSVPAAVASGIVLLRPLWRGAGRRPVARTVVATYFLLLSLGVVGLSVVQLMSAAGYPVARWVVLPSSSAIVGAVLVGVAGGLSMLAGSIALGAVRDRPRESWNRPPAAAARWPFRRVPALIAVGALGAAVVVGSTQQIPLLSPNIDQLRFAQSAGAGFAALLEYEFLLAAAISAVTVVLSPASWKRPAAAVAICLLLLLLFRVERTPLVFLLAVTASALLLSQRTVSRRAVAVACVGAAIAVGTVGVFRLTSQQPQTDAREVAARLALDLGPEFREQAFVYRIYPEHVSHRGTRGLWPIGASLVPAGALGAFGVDKATLYTDSSKQHALTMRRLGIYDSAKPLRVGLVGELWSGFGWAGVLIGMFLWGALVAAIDFARPTDVGAFIMRCLCAAFAMVGLVTPLAALAPVALVVLASGYVVLGRTPAEAPAMRPPTLPWPAPAPRPRRS